MPVALICRRCGAPLPEAGEGTVTCAHCGTAHRLGPDREPNREEPPAVAGRVVVFGMLAVVIAVGGLGLAGAMVVGTVARPVASPGAPVPVRAVPSPAEAPAPPARPALPSWRTLGSAEVGTWIPIEPPPTSTPLEAFEPSAHLAWAETIARVWSPDAVVIRMDVDGVGRDGGLDLVGNPRAEVRYVTFSPTRRAAARELAKVSHDVGPWAVVVNVAGGVVKVMIDDGWELDPEAVPPMRSGCTLHQVLGAVGSKLPERPDHEVRLDWREPYAGLPGWLFDVGGTHVFPTDCAAWTLAEARRRR